MNTKNKKVVLFANGALPGPEVIAQQISKDDYLIAVDGGLTHMAALGLQADLIIGDLDSIDKEQLEDYRKQQVKIEKFPIEKDQNDLELAIHAAVEMNPKTIWIVAALGNRIDQTLANIFLLARDDLADIDVHLIDGMRDVFLIRKEASLTGEVGQIVSLIPIFGSVSGIHTIGLKYPLKNETLYHDQTRGISNHLTGTSARITVEKGLLLCIHKLTTSDERSG